MVSPGGAATLYGVLYQILGSLHHTVRLLTIQGGEDSQAVLGARLILEPPEGGGDLRIEGPGQRVVEQWKARTTGRPWGLQDILDKVIPDLYLDPALDLPGDQTMYVFATEGYAGPKAHAFFQRLSGPVPRNPLAGLSKQDSEKVRASASRIGEPSKVVLGKLRRLLARFEIRENQTTAKLVAEIDRMLLPLVDYVEDIPDIRDQLCGLILRKGSGQGMGNEFMPEDLLKEAGLRGISLEKRESLQRAVREILDREVGRRKYESAKDVREVPTWPGDKSILFLSGESGQGKTWQSARLMLDRVQKERLVALADSRGDAERDLQRASDLLWKEAWGRERPLSFDRLVERWRQIYGDAVQPWLTVCLENVQNLGEARRLVADYDWERWGVELVMTGSPQIGAVLAEEDPERIHHVRLQDFKGSELREYLQRHGRSWETVPADVRDTLKRPLLAGLYTSLGSDPDWAPTREYELYEKAWRRLERDLSQNPTDVYLLKRLALRLLDEESNYPWSWDQLIAAEVNDEAFVRLERMGWWTRNDEGVEVWHDRMLSWALAEALAERGSADDIASYLRRRPENPRIRRIFAYVSMDVLWLLSGNPKRRQLVPDLLINMEHHERPSGYHRLYQAGLLPTLGWRIADAIIERLRRLPDQARASYRSLIAEALSKILEREPARRAELPALLTDSSLAVRKVAVKVLARHPVAAAIGPLWKLLRDKSLAIEQSSRGEGMSDRQAAFAALRACLELDPNWLRFKIQESRPEEEPVWELAYLLANIKHPAASSIWRQVKNDLFSKVQAGKLHSLMVCIRVFRDLEEVSRLEAWLAIEERWTDNNALAGIARIDPDRAVALLETVPLSVLLHSQRAWLSSLLLNRPSDIRRVLRKRMLDAGADFWQVAHLYWWYEEQMDRETVETLLDRLAIEVAEVAQDAEEALSRLRLALSLLPRIHRVDLLESFQARSDTDLDFNLGNLGRASFGKLRHDIEEIRSVLLKIGGEGLRRLIQAGIASSDSDFRQEAMAWGLIYPEELVTRASREEWILAAVGEDRVLVEQMLTWEEDIEDDDLQTIWRLRRWKPPMSNTDLLPALEALKDPDLQKQVQALAAISISARADLLSRLPEWMQDLTNSRPEYLHLLDLRIVNLVHRFAEGNQEGLLQLARILDVRCFPWTAVQVLYESDFPELADRLESELMAQWTSTRRLRMDIALELAQVKRISAPLLMAIWESGKAAMPFWTNYNDFFSAVSRIDSEEVRETIWQEAFEARHTGPRIDAIRALNLLEPEEALRAARRRLEDPTTPERTAYVSLIFEMGGPETVPWLLEQAGRETKTEVLWSIARVLRGGGAGVTTQLQTMLESPDFRIRSVAAHLVGWQGPGALEADLLRMAEEDPDDDVQWECRQALTRQHKEHYVLELMNAFREAQGTTRWSYLESILELGDPRLLVTEFDPLWLGQILTPELGALEVHANFRLEQRFREINRTAEQRDQS